jgi:hypothetical protein
MRCPILWQIFREKGEEIGEERERKREREGQNYGTKIRRRNHLGQVHRHAFFHDGDTTAIDFRDGGCHCAGRLAFDDLENDLERVNGLPLASNCTDLRPRSIPSPNFSTVSKVTSLFK